MEARAGQGRPAKSLVEEILKRFMANANSTKGKMIKIKGRQKKIFYDAHNFADRTVNKT